MAEYFVTTASIGRRHPVGVLIDELLVGERLLRERAVAGAEHHLQMAADAVAARHREIGLAVAVDVARDDVALRGVVHRDVRTGRESAAGRAEEDGDGGRGAILDRGVEVRVVVEVADRDVTGLRAGRVVGSGEETEGAAAGGVNGGRRKNGDGNRHRKTLGESHEESLFRAEL